MAETPKPRPHRESLDSLVDQNVAAIARIEEADRNSRTRADVVADAIANFCGSIVFVYVHMVLFSGWLIWNCLPMLSKGEKFDPPPFNMLTLIVSLEAIFLTTFVLISQNRQQRTADQRNHLDLQINMLAEQESSQMLIMMKQVMDHLGLDTQNGSGEVLEQATDPEKVAKQISMSQQAGHIGGDKVSNPKSG